MMDEKGTYYRLKDGVVLRGWSDLPCALVDLNQHQVLIGGTEKAKTALACDGNTDFSSILMPEFYRQYAEELVERGLAVPCQKGETLKENQRFYRFDNPYIADVHWELTGRCNFRCRHCYMSAPGNKLPHLSLKSILHVVDELAACGIYSVELTGGEPLVRRDLPQIITALSGKNIGISRFFSNGALVDDTLLDHLERNGQSPVLTISFDGAGGWHDWMRGVPGATEMAERAIRLWRSRGWPVWGQAVIHKGNAYSIRDTVLRMAELDVTRFRCVPARNEGEWLKNSDGNEITLEEFFQAVLDYLPYYYEDGMPLDLSFADIIYLDPNKPDQYVLQNLKDTKLNPLKPLLACKKGSLNITCEGYVIICDELGADFMKKPPLVCDDPDVETAHLSEIIGEGSAYQRAMALTVSDMIHSGSECVNCKWFRFCRGGCRAQALKNGNIFGKCSMSCKMFLDDKWIERTVSTMKRIRPEAHSVPPVELLPID